MSNKYKRAGGAQVTMGFVDGIRKAYASKPYPVPKYVLFIENALKHGCHVNLYMAQKTVSKYVTVQCGNKQYKVRFSNHKPIPYREASGDCDFFVGVTNYAVTTTEQAWAAMMEHFGKAGAKWEENE